jgi:hypothetical protein
MWLICRNSLKYSEIDFGFRIETRSFSGGKGWKSYLLANEGAN